MRKKLVKKPPVVEKIFLDSGAFSALMQKVEINIYEYMEYINDNAEHIEIYANLDSIGSAVKSHANLKIMEDEGFHPVPVYHLGEPLSYLKLYAENYDYIAIGGVAGLRSGNSLKNALDICWSKYLLKDNGDPVTKVHGFGLTSAPIMTRYPWHSVDSTSWIRVAGFGNVLVPRIENGEYCYYRPPFVVPVSSESPSRKNKDQHFDTYSNSAKKKILEYMYDKGFTLDDLQTSWKSRAVLNLRFYQGVQNYCNSIEDNTRFKRILKYKGFFV